MLGVLLRGIGGFYTVRGDDGATYILRPQNKLRRARAALLAGDRVEFAPGEGEQHGWLEDVLPRKNRLIRPPVANVDVVALVVAASAPLPDFRLVDAMLIEARRADIGAVLAINKLDEGAERAKEVYAQYEQADVGLFMVCARTGDGVAELKAALVGKVCVFAGQSGVGKSSLINAMFGVALETGALSEKIERGKNTTRRCELMPVDGGGMALDTPGFSLLETPLSDPLELRALVPEIARYEGQCRFAPCAHVSEPDCAVRSAVERGEISKARWERYAELYVEMQRRWKERYD